MAATIFVNGRITGQDEAVIPVLDHGFLYGEGVYEVMRTYKRAPFLFERHMDRMRRSAAMINLQVPFTDADVLDRIRQTADAFYRSQGEAGAGMEMYIRVLLTRGVGSISYEVELVPGADARHHHQAAGRSARGGLRARRQGRPRARSSAIIRARSTRSSSRTTC